MYQKLFQKPLVTAIIALTVSLLGPQMAAAHCLVSADKQLVSRTQLPASKAVTSTIQTSLNRLCENHQHSAQTHRKKSPAMVKAASALKPR